MSNWRSLIAVSTFTGLAMSISYLWIDRPFALWSHENLHQYAIFDQMTLFTGWFSPMLLL